MGTFRKTFTATLGVVSGLAVVAGGGLGLVFGARALLTRNDWRAYRNCEAKERARTDLDMVDRAITEDLRVLVACNIKPPRWVWESNE